MIKLKPWAVALVFAPAMSAAHTQSWSCKGLWAFRSFQLFPAVEISAQITTTSIPESPQPFSVLARGQELKGTSTLRPPDYVYKLETRDRSVVLEGSFQVAVDPSPLNLSVSLTGMTTAGSEVTGLLKCDPN